MTRLPPDRAPVADTGLLLFAHGTPDGSGGAIAAAVAAALTARGRFAEVAVCFSRQPPSPAAALAAMRSPRVLVAPLLTCRGGLATRVLPALLAEAGQEDRWSILPPLGELPGIAGIAQDLVQAALAGTGLSSGEVAVLVAGHGSSRDPASRAATEALARTLASSGGYGGVGTVFLSEEPVASGWRRVTAAQRVVVVPFLLSGGNHEEHDLPALLREGGGGLDGREIDGRRLWLTPAMGRHPAIPALVEAAALAAADKGAPEPQDR